MAKKTETNPSQQKPLVDPAAHLPEHDENLRMFSLYMAVRNQDRMLRPNIIAQTVVEDADEFYQFIKHGSTVGKGVDVTNFGETPVALKTDASKLTFLNDPEVDRHNYEQEVRERVENSSCMVESCARNEYHRVGEDGCTFIEHPDGSITRR